MSYIAPDGDIHILKNIPLDAGYTNTISFQSAQEQIGYFLNPTRVKMTLTRQYYSRIERGVLRVQVYENDSGISGADYLRDCNYLCFTNNATSSTTGYSHKWYFAFINSVEYVNNAVAEIRFQLDVMQTWMFNYALKPCYVEREHSDSDRIGEHVLPEPVDATQYCMENLQIRTSIGWSSSTPQLEWFTNGWSVVVWATFDQNYNDYQAQVSGSMFNGLCAVIFVNNGNAQAMARTVNAWINGAVEAGKEDGIVAINMFPNAFLPSSSYGTIDSTQLGSTVFTRQTVVQRIPSWGTAVGIRNNKLYSYPYTMITAQNHLGDTLHYRYEWFPASEITFNIRCALSPTSQADLSALNYNGANGLNPAERLTITNFPQCAYNTDAYKAWMAQNSVSIGISTVSSLLGAASTAFTAGQYVMGGSSLYGTSYSSHQNLNTGATVNTRSSHYLGTPENVSQVINRGNQSGLIGSLLNAGTTIANNANAMRLASIQPPVARGSQSNVLDVAYGRFGFYLYQTHLTLEAAKSIDNFFTRYGYNCSKVKIPNTRVRERWTYTKTAGCNAIPITNAGLPADDLEMICRIYDSGITFWRYQDGMDVGNYDMTNDCLSTPERFIIISPSTVTVKPGNTFTVAASVGYSSDTGVFVEWNYSSPYLEYVGMNWDKTTGTGTLTLRVTDNAPHETEITITATNKHDTGVTSTCKVIVAKEVAPVANVRITTEYDNVSCVCGYTLIQAATVTLSAIGDNTVTWSIKANSGNASNSTDGIILEEVSNVVSDYNPLVSVSTYGIICNTWALPGNYTITITSNQDKTVSKTIGFKLTPNYDKNFYVVKSTFKYYGTSVRNSENKIAYWYYISTNSDYDMAYGRIGTSALTQYEWAKIRELATVNGKSVAINDPALIDGTKEDCIIARTIDNQPTNKGTLIVYISNHLLESLEEDMVTGNTDRVILTYPLGTELNSAGLLNGDDLIEITTESGNTLTANSGDEICTEETNAQYIVK